MFLAPHDLATVPVTAHGVGGNDDSYEHDPVLFDNTHSYLMWAFAAAAHRYPTSRGNLSELDGASLRDTVAELISGWHPVLRRMVADTPAGSVSLLPIRTSVPVDAWPSTNITLLGDAIHSMTPMRGIGANVALRDAHLLCRHLTAAIHGNHGVVDAIALYEREMIKYGFTAVRDSRRSATQFVSENAISRIMFKAVLRLFRAFPALRRKAFRDLGDD